MKIILDFDKTLFNTEGFKDEIIQLFEKMGYEMDDIQSTYSAECLDYKYSPVDQLKRLQQIEHKNSSLAIARIENLYKRTYRYIYPDVVEFIKTMKEKGHKVYLLTLGDISFQKRKVVNSGIDSLFDKIYYCDIPKWEFIKELVDEGEKFVFIDDRGDTVYEIGSRYKNAFPLIINRDNGVILKEYANQIVIKNLAQAAKLLS